MGLRNVDFDSVVRQLCEAGPEAAQCVAAAASARCKALGLKPAGAVPKAPKHTGRRNPLSGKVKGSGDLNLRGILDFIESVDKLPTDPPAPKAPEGEVVTAEQHAAHEQACKEHKVAHAAMIEAHERLKVIAATASHHAP